MRRLVTLLVVGVLLGACGSSVDTAADAVPGDADGAPTQPDDGGSAAGSPTDSADLVPFGVVETVDGATVDGAEYAGQSLALWFWAPW